MNAPYPRPDPRGISPAFDLPRAAYADYVLDALWTWRREGLRTALLTLVRVDGTSPRPVGSQLAVAEDGRAVGAITGGCAEQSLVFDAVAAMARGINHLEIYGRGSRFKDLILPCGSGIEVWFDVTLADDDVQALRAARQARRPAAYVCDLPDGRFTHVYEPQRRLLIFGRGNVVPALAQLGRLTEYDTHVFCPDDWIREQCRPYAMVNALRTPADWDEGLIDAATAVVCLFHDHDYEPDLLGAGLASPAFYLGALGSRQTQARRLDSLRKRGWNDDQLDRIRGPVGLDINARTPPEIAVAIMAEIVAAARRT